MRKTAALEGIVQDASGRGIAGALIALTNRATGMTRMLSADADGVFRLTDLAPGTYLLLVEGDGFEKMTRNDLRLDAGDVVTLELTLARSATFAIPRSRLPRMPELGPEAFATEAAPAPSFYRNLPRRPDEQPGEEAVAPEEIPPAAEVFQPAPDRWNVAMPAWNRYGRSGDYPYVRANHWWDPFNRNRLKGDMPIFGQQTFLNITGTSDTFLEERRVPATSNISSARPGSDEFFGKGEQFAFTQTFRVSFDLFHGDASFRPVDWRIRIT
ncbi:MAG: carboxypeptidase-like regulatory domain-containing protein, partial [Candidatus Acidiferrales bacterium]